jgi:asparagine N-glycosylation enzyme membrane subunit Stt3
MTLLRRTFLALAGLLLLVVVTQFFFAASGAFGRSQEAYRPHHVFGYVIFIVGAVVAIVGAVARVRGRLIGEAALVAGLTGLQVIIAEVAGSFDHSSLAGQLIFGFHAITGLAILGVSGLIFRQARAWESQRAG